MSTVPATSSADSMFEKQCREAVSELQASLIELYDRCGLDPGAPQEAARRFELNKTLTWTVARLVQEGEPLTAASLVPGRGSIERVVAAAERFGAEGLVAERVRDAAIRFEAMAKHHVGDRSELELALDSMGVGANEALDLSRRLAFRGNSGIHGVQARTRLLCAILMPGATEDRVDLAMISGYVGFRRLRHTSLWPLFKVRSWGDAEERVSTERWQPIDGAEPNGILPEFRRGYAAELQEAALPGGSEFVLQPGPIGNDGAFDLFRGEVLRNGASRYAGEDGQERTGEFGANITTPAEHLVFDLVAHESLSFALNAEALVFSRIFDQGHATDSGISERLPINQKPIALSGQPPAMATPLVPGYRELFDSVAQRIGLDPRECGAVRVEMRYPPLGSTVSMRFDLPSRP